MFSERVLLEGLHPELVVRGVVEVEALLLEVDPLGVGLLGVDRQLPQAVGDRWSRSSRSPVS